MTTVPTCSIGNRRAVSTMLSPFGATTTFRLQIDPIVIVHSPVSIDHTARDSRTLPVARRGAVVAKPLQGACAAFRQAAHPEYSWSPRHSINGFGQSHSVETENRRGPFLGLDFERHVRALIGALDANVRRRVNDMSEVFAVVRSGCCDRNDRLSQARFSCDTAQWQLADLWLRPQGGSQHIEGHEPSIVNRAEFIERASPILGRNFN